MQLEELTGRIIGTHNGLSEKVIELQITPQHDMLLLVYFEKERPMGFALFEMLEEELTKEKISHQDLYLSNHGHYDVHPDCELDFEKLCKWAVEKQLDLDSFITAIQFDHPLASLAPLEIELVNHSNPRPSEEEYWETLAQIQLH
jgi:hypothetical protein